MNNTQLFVPDNILAGYNSRKDTYTGKLAYLIYRDIKGKLKKEKSWRGWLQEDLGTDEFENVPTEGFVINKNVGGYKHDWFYRSEKVRIYDPRGFEIEITMNNLLYILEYTNSIKGKGLEGELVYGWVGAELFLIPCDSPQYQEIKAYNDLLRSDLKLTGKTIVIGNTYKTDKENDVIYLGRYNYYDNNRRYIEDKEIAGKFNYHSIDRGKKYWFVDVKSGLIHHLPLNQIKAIVNDVPSEKTSEYVETLLKRNDTNPYVVKETNVIKTKEDLLNLILLLNERVSSRKHKHKNGYSYSGYSTFIYLKNEHDNIVKKISLSVKREYNYEVKGQRFFSEYKPAILSVLKVSDMKVGIPTNRTYSRNKRSLFEDKEKEFFFIKDIHEKLLTTTERETFDVKYKDTYLTDEIINDKLDELWIEISKDLSDNHYSLYGRIDTENENHYLFDNNYVELNKKHS